MKKIIIFILCIYIHTTLWYQEHIVKKLEGKNVNYINVILDGKHKIITSLSKDGDTLENLVNNVWWISWVNGAYFCPADYAKCDGVNYSENSRYYEWESHSKYGADLWASGLFWFDKNGVPLFILNNYGYVDGINKKINEDKLPDVEYGIANFPVLVLQWKNVISESKDILESKQIAKWIKSFICSEDDNKTIKMWTVDNVTVEELADFLQLHLDCYNAINLDSWGSLGMVYNNENIKKPGRKIMDAFVVVENKEKVKDSVIIPVKKVPSKNLKPILKKLMH